MNNKLTLSVRYKDKNIPAVEIIESEDQVVVRFIHKKIHWTLHSDGDDIKLTVQDLEHWSTWSSEKIEIARKCGFADPEKHGHYLFHDLIRKGFGKKEIGAIRFLLKPHPKDKKYLKNSVCIGDSISENVWIKGSLYSQDLFKNNAEVINTKLGYLRFELEN